MDEDRRYSGHIALVVSVLGFTVKDLLPTKEFGEDKTSAVAGDGLETVQPSENHGDTYQTFSDSDGGEPSTHDITAASEIEAVPKTGQIVTFGSYPQNGSEYEPISWIVLHTDGNTALLQSERALDCVSFNSERCDVGWENYSLRSWLNNSFYSQAFSEAERSRIIGTKLPNHDNP